MSKTLAIGAAACATAAAAAGAVYYVSPTHQQALDTPPILVEGTPDQVLTKLRGITVERYFQQIGHSQDAGHLLQFSTERENELESTATIYLASDRILVLHARAKPVGTAQTELDITAELPRSRLTAQPDLHPYDIKVLAAFADLAATDYVSSVLKSERPISTNELGAALESRIGFDKDEKDAFGQRLSAAFLKAYGHDVAEIAEAGREANAYGGSDPTPDAYRYPYDDRSGAGAAYPDSQAEPDTDLSRYDYPR